MPPKNDTAERGGPAAAGAPAEPKRFPVKLLKPHTHAGKDLLPGATIEITAAQREWLSGLGVVSTPDQEQ